MLEEYDFETKRGDTRPFKTTLYDVAADGSRTPVNLTTATVRFIMRNWERTTLLIAAAATVTNAVAGQCEYEWQPTEVALAGQFKAEWEVTKDGKVSTYPSRGQDLILIEEDLG